MFNIRKRGVERENYLLKFIKNIHSPVMLTFVGAAKVNYSAVVTSRNHLLKPFSNTSKKEKQRRRRKQKQKHGSKTRGIKTYLHYYFFFIKDGNNGWRKKANIYTCTVACANAALGCKRCAVVGCCSKAD